jgi:hypothetical protein
MSLNVTDMTSPYGRKLRQHSKESLKINDSISQIKISNRDINNDSTYELDEMHMNSGNSRFRN